MVFKGNGWSVVLIGLDGADQWVRTPQGSIVHHDFVFEFRCYVIDEYGWVLTVSNIGFLELLARIRPDGRLYVSLEHPRTNRYLYERLIPNTIVNEEYQERLKPFQKQLEELNKNVVDTAEELNKNVVDKFEAFDKRTANIEGLHTVLIRELGTISRETQAQTQCLKELLQINRQSMDLAPCSASSTTVVVTPKVQELDEKIEAMRTQNNELQAKMDKLMNLMAKVLNKE